MQNEGKTKNIRIAVFLDTKLYNDVCAAWIDANRGFKSDSEMIYYSLKDFCKLAMGQGIELSRIKNKLVAANKTIAEQQSVIDVQIKNMRIQAGSKKKGGKKK